MTETFLSKADILSIPDELCPMPLLSDNLRSVFSLGIKIHEQGCYNHFMWYIGRGLVASQDYIFRATPIADYFKKYRLKFWYCPLWTKEHRRILKRNIISDIRKPWYKRLYDPLAIVGQALYLDWIQTPGIDICSDKGEYIKLVDKNYSLSHPDPENINRWLESQRGKYQVYGRYVPD